MATLLSLPILGILVIFQTAVASRVNLLQGSVDLVMLALIAWALQPRVTNAWQWALVGGLLVNIPSSMPLGVPLLGYLAATGVALALRRRVWQVPMLAMLVATLVGTLLTLGISWVALQIIGVSLPVFPSFYLVILPSALLNLLLAIPIYTLAGDLASWLYPQELEI
jgi:rod shape-determining protein MreD